MFNVRLAGDHLYGKWLFTWLSLVMSVTVSYFVLLFFSQEMSWMRSGTELSQFLRNFLSTLSYLFSSSKAGLLFQFIIGRFFNINIMGDCLAANLAVVFL